MKRLIRFFTILLLVLISGCSVTTTEGPVFDQEGEVVWDLPSSIEGFYELVSLDETFGNEMYEVRRTGPQHFNVFRYTTFSKNDLEDHPDYSLRNNVLTKEEKLEGQKRSYQKFPVVKINGKLTFNKEEAYDLDLRKNTISEIPVILKKYNDIYILNVYFSEKKFWLPIFFGSSEDQVDVRLINIDKDNADHYSKRLTRLEEFDDEEYLIKITDAEMKTLMKDPDFLESVFVFNKMSPTYLTLQNGLWVGAGGLFLAALFFFVRKKKRK